MSDAEAPALARLRERAAELVHHGAGAQRRHAARWFDGWRPEAANRIPETSAEREVARPRTWLLRVGWRRHGLVDPAELPGAPAPSGASSE